ncbi:MAG: oligosaccharide flippase family protein, partial [Deltaproteobacteria bacterium]|nr:oligosaccharide flippase family protein [Deltaproteobacteria bacterium]
MSQNRSEEPDPSAGAGRGGLALTAAKAWFILLGLVQQIVLPRVLGLDGYGRLSSVLSAASIAYNPIVTTSIQGVSRATAQAAPDARDATLRRVLGVHAVLAVLAATGFFVAAPSLAGFVRAPHLTGGFRVASLVLLFYGLYAPLVGALNGARRFLAQAGFDGALALLRTIALGLGGGLLASRGL